MSSTTGSASFSPPPDIQCREVSVAFDRGPQVLRDLDFSVEPGTMVSLLGPSGCGKSTLLRCLAGLQSIDRGNIQIGGLSPSLARTKMSYVFQDAALLPWRNIVSNVGLPLEMVRVPRRERMERSRDALRLVGLAETHHAKSPSQLSGGMKMRASIARALVTDPSLILLDEPFAALDDMLRSRLNELLLTLHQQQKRTVVFVTHNIAEAVFLSHRVALLMQGRIVRWLEVPFSFPRTSQLRRRSDFAELCGEVSGWFADWSASEARDEVA